MIRSFPIATIAFVLIGGAMPVMAADSCANVTTQAQMNECAAADFKKADADLNAAYKKAQARLEGQDDQKKRLQTAQRAWIAFRDAECAFAGGQGGSVSPMNDMMCQTRLTEVRSADLTKYLECPEGDITCPLPVSADAATDAKPKPDQTGTFSNGY